jgi:hypothetical protein
LRLLANAPFRALVWAGLISATLSPARACTTCGCSASSADFGALPTWGLHTLGIQYRLDRFDNGLSAEGGLASSDRISTLALSGIWSPAARWQVQAQVPYRFQVRTNGEERLPQSGLGDAWLIGRYALWQHQADPTPGKRGALKWAWASAGAGVKAPTGSFRDFSESEGLPINNQIGTGSVDFLGEGRLQLGLGSWILQAEGFYRYNLQNSNEYRFGDQLAGALDARWFLPGTSQRLGLLGGLYAEHFGRDVQRGFYRTDTGGRGLYATAGLMAALGPLQESAEGTPAPARWSAVFRYRAPLAQQYAAGQVRAEGPLDLSLLMHF